MISMNKNIVIGFIFLIVLGVAWYLISPLFITVEKNEESPIVMMDSLDSMDAEKKAEFDAAVDEMKDVVLEMDDIMDTVAKVLKESQFMGRAHEVEGNALLIDDNGKTVLRFENFETVNGPNLHIYLSSELGGDDFIDLGKIKATKGNVNYDVPDGTDLDKYNKVLVWCVPFRVLFSYADLS